MIGRDQVLHVASLARLVLNEDEIAAMQEDLGSVLGHIEQIGELDLAGVSPTSNVIGAQAPPGHALRDDQPQPSLSRASALAAAPSAGEDGFVVPSPQA